MSSSSSVPPFSLRRPRYDQSSFSGRFRHFLDMVDPTTLFTTGTQLTVYQSLLTRAAEAERVSGRASVDGVSDEELWRARKCVESMVHPDTGKVVPMPFRMAGYVPFGTPIVVGLMQPYKSLAPVAFFQWLNQSHNAAVNFANRNASKPTPTSALVQGYAGAVGTAVSIAVGLEVVLRNAQSLKPAVRVALQRFLPYPAVAVANICNVYLMRRQELSQGIEVTDPTGEHVLGSSAIAAGRAVRETAITRVILPAPIFLLPPIVMTMLQNTALPSKLRFLIHVGVSTAAFGLGLPFALACFPQKSKMAVADVEPEIRAKARELGLTEIMFNKGL